MSFDIPPSILHGKSPGKYKLRLWVDDSAKMIFNGKEAGDFVLS